MTARAFAEHNHQHCIDDALRRARLICQQRKVQLTPLRTAILELVWRSHKPLGAYPLMELLRQQRQQEGADNAIAPPTVYRALDFLQQQGLVHRVASLNAFIGCDHPTRHHGNCLFICSTCHDTEEFPSEDIGLAIGAQASTKDFLVQHATVEVQGLCPSCRAADPA